MQTIRPLVAIIDSSKQPVGDPLAAIERAVIGDAAEVCTYLCNSDSDFDEEILESSALIIWHNIPISGAGIRRLKHCKAIIRNGVGLDSVDVEAAGESSIPVCNVPE